MTDPSAGSGKPKDSLESMVERILSSAPGPDAETKRHGQFTEWKMAQSKTPPAGKPEEAELQRLLLEREASSLRARVSELEAELRGLEARLRTERARAEAWIAQCRRQMGKAGRAP